MSSACSELYTRAKQDVLEYLFITNEAIDMEICEPCELQWWTELYLPNEILDCGEFYVLEWHYNSHVAALWQLVLNL